MSFDKNSMANINFIQPQNGRSERIFKQQLLSIFIGKKEIQKAYLVEVQYDHLKERNVALCIQALSEDEYEIVNFISKAFASIFKNDQHLDIFFLDTMQEKKIKSICPPFFNRNLSASGNPDFYLSSSEWQELKEPRKCWSIKQLSYGKRDDFILINIDPFLVYQEKNGSIIILKQLILAGRHLGYSIYPLKDGPTYVYVIRPKRDIYETSLQLEEDDIENIAWGELFLSSRSMLF